MPQVRYRVLAVCQCVTSKMISDKSEDVSKSPLRLEKAQKKKLRGGGGISAWLWRMSRHLSSRDNKKKMYSEKDKSWHSLEAAGVFGIFWWLNCPMPAWMQPLAMHPTAQAGTLLWKGLRKSQNRDLVTRQCGSQKFTGRWSNVAETVIGVGLGKGMGIAQGERKLDEKTG